MKNRFQSALVGPIASSLLKPYCRLQLPGWRRMLLPAVLHAPATGLRRERLRPHGYEMELDLAQPWEHWSFVSRQYYELHTMMLLEELLRPGDTLVDVGANIGHVTLTGAWRVGPSGSVHAIEPNPDAFERLSNHIRTNGLGGVVSLHNVALGTSAGWRTLRVPVEGSGGATLGRLGSEYSGEVARQHAVHVVPGDALLPADGRVSVIKVDVEGFETEVIGGLCSTIQRTLPAILVEAWPEHLENAGSSIEQLLALAGGLGYLVYSVEATPWVRGLTMTSRLKLRRVVSPEEVVNTDVLWLHPESVHAARLHHLTGG